MWTRHFCVDNMIMTMTALIITIHTLIDFVIFMGISVSCIWTKETLQYYQNLTGYLELLFVSLGGPEKCSFIFCFSLLLGKIVGSWEKVFSNVKVRGASILIFLSWKNIVRSLQIKKEINQLMRYYHSLYIMKNKYSCHILIFTMGKLKMYVTI